MKDFKDLLKLERFPTMWCPGCGLGILLKETAKAFQELNFNRNNTVVVSGIGCTGRTAGYFNLDSVHTTHGRAIPVAEGIKRFNEKLNVVVISGDGDILGIGKNHLLHSNRRNTNITVICHSNEVYGMTGGQASPTTKLKAVTLTTPKGNVFEPMNTKGLIRLNKNSLYARTTVAHVDHLHESIKKALMRKGFSFVEVLNICLTNYGRRIGLNTPSDIFKKLKEYQITDKNDLKENEIGIIE